MVAAQFFLPGDLTRDLPPLSPGNAEAIALWNRMGGELRWPDVLYLMTLAHVDDVALMLERLYALRDFFADVARANAKRTRP